MRQRIRRIGDGRMNGIRGKMRVGIHQVLDGRAFGQFSQHEFDRDSRTADRRFAEHDHRVDADVSLYVHADTIFAGVAGYNAKSPMTTDDR